MLETLVKNKIVTYLSDLDAFSQNQHGIQRGRSCLTNLLETFESWSSALYQGKQVDCIFLDFQKAFETVQFNRLLSKLSPYGIEGKVLGWIKCFLTGRMMRVSVEGSYSDWSHVTS